MRIMLSKLSLTDRSYVIGLFQGDGSLEENTRNRGRLSYEISKGDADIVYKLADVFKPHVNVFVHERTRSTNFKDSHESISLTIHNMEFRRELNEFVPYGRKAAIIAPPCDLSERDYIRGLIDADGSLGLTEKGRCFISLCTSSEKIKEYMLASILRVVGRRKSLNRNKRDNVYNIVLFDEDAQVYASFLYKGAGLYIDRKHEKYLEIMEWERTSDRARILRKMWLPSEDIIALSSDTSLEEKMDVLDRTAQSIKMRIWRLKRKSIVDELRPIVNVKG